MQNTEGLKSLNIDVDKGIYELNGEDIGNCVDEFFLTFENGKWVLAIHKRLNYESPVQAVKE